MEAKIQVSNGAGIIERSITISEDPRMREATFGTFEPPIVITHGKGKNDPVEIAQGVKFDVIEMGENRTYLVDGNRKLKIIHEANPEPF